ncbi:MAG: glycoside hydrolase family 43 protein [Gemmataceae bacterium]|nr:glycoside hydrolase family 43 protein [Gemmataceae bacterium]
MATFAVPVYAGYFADPFVWQHRGVYYAVGTGAAEAAGQTDPPSTGNRLGNVFPLLRSDNLMDWHPVGRALARPDRLLGDNFWAPEVAEHDGVFYLYYSVGHGDKRHQLRVAASQRPTGPYEDMGRTLIEPEHCAFAIDPHPFQDDDGRWYLFYARDFLDTEGGTRAGTALAVRPLESMLQLAEEETVVLRARFDWQRFLRDRPMYGRLFDWHTLEGPCVRKHDGRYYCFYSGGRWETEGYGVDYAVADHVLGPYATQDAAEGPRVLRSVPGERLGPGHNSIAVGPDGRTDFIVYHAWDPAMTARRMFVAPLAWTADGPRLSNL